MRTVWSRLHGFYVSYLKCVHQKGTVQGNCAIEAAFVFSKCCKTRTENTLQICSMPCLPTYWHWWCCNVHQFFFNICTSRVWLLVKDLEVVVTRRFYAHLGFAFTWLGFSSLLRILAELHCMCISAQFLVVAIILMLYRRTIPGGQDGCTWSPSLHSYRDIVMQPLYGQLCIGQGTTALATFSPLAFTG